ncbi:MAG: CoA-binding protein [Promethearchaeota archaeon]
MSDSRIASTGKTGALKYSKRDLDPFFNPKSVVIVGASRNTFTFNGMILKNLLELRYAGTIYLVNPNASDIHGIKPLKRVQDLPEVPDLGVIVIRKGIRECLEALGRIGVRRVMIEAEFVKGEFLSLRKEIAATIEKYDLIVFGPSMIGVINYPANFTTSIIPTRIHIIEKNRGERKTSGLAFVAQSGGLAGSLGWWSPPQALPISKVVHLGEGSGVKEHHVLRYLFEDDETRVISLLLKEVTPELVEVVKMYRGIKPVLFKTVGHPPGSEDLAVAGAIRVRDYIDLFEFGKLFLWSPLPRGNRLGIIGPSSGAIALFLDEMEEQGLVLSEPSRETRDFIRKNIKGSVPDSGNPVDYWPPSEFVGTKVCKVYHNASQALLADDNVDGLFLALEFFSEIEFDFAIFNSIQKAFPEKPIVAVLIQAERDGAKRIKNCSTQLKIPVFENEVERAVRGFRALLDFAQTRDDV